MPLWFDYRCRMTGWSLLVYLVVVGMSTILTRWWVGDWSAMVGGQPPALLWVVLAGGWAATGITGWLLASAAARAMASMQDAVEQIEPKRIRDHIDVEKSAPEVRELANKVEEARRRIAEALDAQERFIANVSHEFRTPIAVLLAEAQLLIRSEPFSETEAREFAHSVEEEMRRLKEVVEAFLVLIQVEHGKRKFLSRPVDVADAVLEAVQAESAYAQQTGVRIVSSFTDEVMSIQLSGDERLFRQMVSNLIRNAVRFSPTGEAVRVTAGLCGSPAEAATGQGGAGPGIGTQPQHDTQRRMDAEPIEPALDHAGGSMDASGNAIKREPAAGEAAAVFPEASGETEASGEPGVVIAVNDVGPGVPESIRDTLFDRFTQAPSESGRERGTGLGLQIARGVAELHHGRITVENHQRAGCTFTIWLPLAERPVPPRV